MDRSKTFIQKGHYDTNNYRQPNNDLSENDRIEQSKLYSGPYVNFKLTDQIIGDRVIVPIDIPYSRQIYRPNFNDNYPNDNNIRHSDEYFKLGDPYVPLRGSNLNAPGSNNPKFQYNSIDLLQDGINELFKTIDEETITKINTKVAKTHNNELEEEYNNDNNRSLPFKRINDHSHRPDFLDNNVKGVQESINEYIINISSVDRDCEIYPNPFNYSVFFNAVASNTGSGKNSFKNNNAQISKAFKNIKYINLKSVTVPRKYFIINKKINLFTTLGNDTEFINLFLNTPINNPVMTYQKFRGIITFGTFTYYFYYYKQTIGQNNNYFLCTYDIYFDKNYKQKIDIQIGTSTNEVIIKNFFTTPLEPIVGYTVKNDTIDINDDNDNHNHDNNADLEFASEWILVDKSTDKIKFCKKNSNFNKIINQTFEIRLTQNNTIDSIMYYILLDSSLEDDRYILLNINEIDTNYEYATDQEIENSFSILFPDYVNGDYYYLDSAHHEKVYDHGNLGNISRMTIKFKNSSGKELKSFYNKELIDFDIKTPKDRCICKYDETTGEHIRNYQCSHSYLRHQGYEKLQNTLLFKLGIVEGSQDIQHV